MTVDADMSGSDAVKKRAADKFAVLHAIPGAILGGLGRLWLRHANLFGSLIIFGFIAVIMAVSYLRPVHAWDMIAYIASSVNHTFDDATALHTHVWDIVRNGTSPEEFAELSQGDSFRMRQFSDPDAFRSMLPMFEVKLLYVKLIGLLTPLTGAVHAGFVINIAAALIFALTSVWWLLKARLMHLAPLVIALFMVAGLPAMVMGESPDFLCAALAMSGILMLERDKPLAGGIALVLAVGARPDMVAFTGVLFAASWFWSYRHRLAVTMTFAVSVAVYLFASKLAHHPGWWPHVWFSTYQFQETMAGFDPDFSLRVYLTGFAWNIVRSAFENSWLGVYITLLGGWALMHASGLRFPRERHVLIAATLAAVGAKFVVFPLHDERVYLPLLLPAAFLLMAAIRDAAKHFSDRWPELTKKAK